MPPGMAMQEWQFCVGGTCSLPCGMGERLGCVSAYAYPSPPGTVARVTLWASAQSSLFNGEPHVRAFVRACARTDLDCARPMATAHTDGQGYAEMELPTPGAGFTGYFEVTTEDGTTGLFVPSYAIKTDSLVIAPVPAGDTRVAPQEGPRSVRLWLFDCLGAFVRDGRFETSTGQVVYDAPSDKGAHAAGSTTGWVLDAAPGLVEVRGYKDDLLVALEQVPVRAGMTTVIGMLPISYNPIRFHRRPAHRARRTRRDLLR
jgi:hypothetical protein